MSGEEEYVGAGQGGESGGRRAGDARLTCKVRNIKSFPMSSSPHKSLKKYFLLGLIC